MSHRRFVLERYVKVSDEVGHINIEELTELLGLSVQDPDSSLELPATVQRHAAHCEPCKKLLLLFKQSGVHLQSIRALNYTIVDAPCPDVRELRSLACGTSDANQTEGLAEHIFHCDKCALAYRQFTAEVSPDITEEERSAISRLNISLPSSQLALAKALAQNRTESMATARTTRPAGLSRLTRYGIPIALAACLLVSVGYFWRHKRLEFAPTALIAKAYAERRTFELRFQGAPFGKIRRERGESGSVLDKPESLLEAEFRLKQLLRSDPNDAVLLDAEGQTQLLEWDYNGAVESLNKALVARPQWPQGLSDLAIAYTQRGDQESRPLDYGRAIELLGQAIVAQPKDPVFFFNRAIVEERLDLLEEAKKDWLLYLQLDSQTEWATEARQHLGKIEQKLQQSMNQERPRDDLRAAISDLREMLASSPTNGNWTDSRDEDYIDSAIMNWLPGIARAQVAASPTNLPLEWEALRALAAVVSVRHHDGWLRDALALPPSKNAAYGWRELGRAARANSEGDFTSAAVDARKAEAAFRNSSDALYLLSVWEHAYAMQRSQSGTACFDDTKQGLRRLGRLKYPWISVQLRYEEGICSEMLGAFNGPNEWIGSALANAEAAGYQTLLLRGYHLQGIRLASHDPNEAWLSFKTGLELHWAGPYRPFRVYHYYAEMALTAENRSEWQLARTLMYEACFHIRQTNNRLTTAIALQMLATDSEMAGYAEDASLILAQAHDISASITRSPAVDELRASVQIEQATLLCQQGQCASAVKLLRSAQPFLSRQSQYRTWFQYYSALGEALLQSGSAEAAERALGRAIDISDRVASSIVNDGDRLQWRRQSQNAYRSMVALEFNARHNSALAFSIWSQYVAAPIQRPIGRSVQSENVASYDAIAVRLHPLPDRAIWKGATFLSFAEFDDDVIAWKYDDSGMKAVRLRVATNRLRPVAAQFLALCSDPRSNLNDLRRLGAQLYAWLIAPFENDLPPGRTIAIQADGILTTVPFAALVTSDGQYFGQEYTLVNSLGPCSWMRLRTTAAFRPQDRLLVVASPFGSTGQGTARPFLEEAYAEASEVAHRFRNPDVLAGGDANLRALKREIRGIRVLHFVGHSIATDTSSGLIVAEAQSAATHRLALIGPTQLQALALDSIDLVMLSACSSEGKDPGDGTPYPLVTPFLRAGVPHVIATQWPIDSNATVAFVKEFYDGLFESGHPAAALRLAYDAMSKVPSTAHPYYWAGFTAFGR